MAKRFKSNWINLHDDNGARLLAGYFQGRLVAVIRGVRPRSPEYYKVLAGTLRRRQDIHGLRFQASPSGASLIHTCAPGEQIYASQFHSIWPNARFEEMDSQDYFLDFDEMATRNSQGSLDAVVDQTQTGEQAENLLDILNRSEYLGRNERSQRVFENITGRFYVTDEDKIEREDAGLPAHLFLHAENETQLRACAAGLLRACEKGEAQKEEDLLRFAATVFGKSKQDLSPDERGMLARAIDSALLATLMERGTPHQASADATYFQEMMPGRAALAPDSTVTPFVPAPVAVQAQRLLATCATLRLDGKIPPFGFGLLPESTHVFVAGQDTDAWDAEASIQPTWSNIGSGQTADAVYDCEGGYMRISRNTPKAQVQEFIDSIAANGLCIVTAGSQDDLASAPLAQNTSVLRTVCIPPWLSLTELPVYLAILRKNGEQPALDPSPVVTLTGWEDLKVLVDETLRVLGKKEDLSAAPKASESKTDNRFQRPYLSRSKASPSSTMVPKNLQAPISLALSRVEASHGPIDQFFCEEMGLSQEVLAERFSAEQVDAASLIFHRIYSGKGFILGDETGIGKGRVIAATAVWAMRQNRKIIFITDKCNLFSDFARDLKDIKEWDRVRPLITNSDGAILDIMGEGDVLAEPLAPATMRRHLNGEPHNANIIFTTYSQINAQESDKAAWLREQARDALVIADESHIAAGSDSNVANNLNGMLDQSWGVLYSSATWAKTANNLHIYRKAMPESVNLAQLAQSMKSSNGAFGEVFSSMLATDGAFIRREHDLSKIDFVIEVDEKHRERNVQIQAQLSEILGMMSLISGDINHMLQRLNNDTRQDLEAARQAHDDIHRLEHDARQAAAQNDEAAQIENTTKPRMFTSSFGTGGAIYSVMRRCMAALAVDHAVDKAIEDVQEGRRSVIVLDETGETFVKAQINEEIARVRAEIVALRERDARGESPEDAEEAQRVRTLGELLDANAQPADIVQAIRIPTIQDLMRNLVGRLGGIRVTEIHDPDEPLGTTGDEEQTLSAHIDLESLPGITAEMVEKYEKGILAINEKIAQLPRLSISPIDSIREKLQRRGLTVGEISGRMFSLHQPDTDSEEGIDPSKLVRLEKRARKKIDVTRTVADFNAGRTDVAIINKRAATGVSMHASPRFADTRQRHLLEIQPDENPANRIQLFGRVNRFDQVTPPRISIMTNGLKSEMRSIMMQNRKLTDLSANIRSSRENAALINDVPDLLNRTGDKVCQEYLLENPAIASRLEITSSRLKDAAGLANFLTQRVILLTPAQQDKVYEDLRIAYEDALLENELTQDSDAIPLRDWRASTIKQKLAWGPTENLDALSAFDGPVYTRVVTHQVDYQPWSWARVCERIAQSSQALLADERVKREQPLAVIDTPGSYIFSNFLDMEKRLPPETQKNLWAHSLLSHLASYLPAQALVNGENADFDEDERDSSERNESEAVSIRTDLDWKNRPKKGFESIGAHWVGISARIQGTRQTQRFMALISRSGKTAKLWSVDARRRTAQVYTVDLDEAIRQHDHGAGAVFRDRGTLSGLRQDSWMIKRFERVWGSVKEGIELLDTAKLTQSGSAVLRAQQAIALPGINLPTIEAALASSEANPVKEAHHRMLFMEKVISKLVPGVSIWVRRPEQRGLSLLSEHFAGKTLVLTNIRLPKPGNESLLSHWKFHFISPSDEKEIVLSGALLFKMAGKPPTFHMIDVDPNIFSGDLRRMQRAFDMHHPQTVTLSKSLLVGNIYQAGQWAREARMGSPILYTDETGATHRAIELNRVRGMHGLRMINNFPVRLHHHSSINALIDWTFSQVETVGEQSGHGGYFTSIRGALLEPGDNKIVDRFFVSPRNNAIIWMVPKEEKERIRRSLRAAVAVDKEAWLREHPDSQPTDYPVKFSTKSARRNESNQSRLTIALPETTEGRRRFIELLVASQGLQLYVPDHQFRAKVKAQEIEQAYYQQLSQPALEALEHDQRRRERRAQTRALIGTGTPDTAASKPSVPEQAEALLADVQLENGLTMRE